MLSGAVSQLSKDAFLKAIDEILSRLPLSLLIANDRAQFANPTSKINLVYEYCVGSCYLLFQSLIANFQLLRKGETFQSCWLRFLSILSTNANMLVRATLVHNDMLDMIANLIRILKLSNERVLPPATTVVTSRRNSTASTSAESTTASSSTVVEAPIILHKEAEKLNEVTNPSTYIVTPKKTNAPTAPPTAVAAGGGGWLNWWGVPNTDQQSEEVTTTSTIPVTSTQAASTIPNPSATASLNSNNLTSSSSLLLSVSQLPQLELPQSATTAIQKPRNDDQESMIENDNDNDLLIISWKSMCSVYPSLPAHLRIRYPQLVLDICAFIDSHEKRIVSSQTAVFSTSAIHTSHTQSQTPVSPSSSSPDIYPSNNLSSSSSSVNLTPSKRVQSV